MEVKLKLISALVVAVLLGNMWFLWQVASGDDALPVVLVSTAIAASLVLMMVKIGVDVRSQTSEACRTKLAELGNIVDNGNYQSAVHFSQDEVDEDASLMNAQIEGLVDKLRLHAEQQQQQMTGLSNLNYNLYFTITTASNGLMLLDSNRNIKVINDKFIQLLATHSGHIQTGKADSFFGKNITTVFSQHDVLSRLASHAGAGEPEQLKGNNLVLELAATAVPSTGDILIECVELSSISVDEDASIANAQMCSALDTVSSNIMITDANNSIVYVNDALKNMLNSHQSELMKNLPTLNVEDLIGVQLEQFDSSIRGAAGHGAESKQQVHIGEAVFELVISGILDSDGNSIGSSVEWHDLTEQLQHARQAELDAQIKAAIDNVSANFMVADNQQHIAYLNGSLHDLFNQHAASIQQSVPGFAPNSLVGQNLDEFHAGISLQQMPDSASGASQFEATFGELFLQLTVRPIVNNRGEKLGTLVEWLDISDVKHRERLEANNSRIKVALDSVNTNVMVADAEYNIVYTNDSIDKMLKAAEADLRKELSQFSASDIIGKNIDIFHKNPSHQRRMLDALTHSYDTKISVGGRHFNLLATPVVSERKRIGTVVEWKDITQKTTVERDVESLVSNVAKGNLDTQIELSGKDGFYLSVSEGLNTLAATINSFVKDISTSVEQMSNGNLDTKIDTSYSGAFGNVTLAVNATIDKLNSVMSQIQLSSSEVSSANNEISRGNNELSDRTEQQAASLVETASSLDELTSNIRNTADNAKIANNAALGAQNEASTSESIMNEAMKSMAAITESSNRIVEIISVIDEIAFQTNLLALNASVEAARAGEQGRGFAVVANEVRNLAQRSAVSAKEIKELIDVSSERVRTGSDLVNKCATSLGDILKHAGELSSIIGEIATATNEQATGVGEINQSVAQLDNITQQNASLSEEVTSASASSLAQIEGMMQQIGFFTVNGGTGAKLVSAPKASTKTPVKREPAKSHQASNNTNKTKASTALDKRPAKAMVTTRTASPGQTTATLNKPKPSLTAVSKAKAPVAKAPAPKAKAPAPKLPVKPPVQTSNNLSVTANLDAADEWEEF